MLKYGCFCFISWAIKSVEFKLSFEETPFELNWKIFCEL